MNRLMAAVIGLSLVSAGCSIVKDSKQMKGNMVEMKDTLGELDKKGQHIAKRADDLEREAKKDRSAAAFVEYMKLLFGENGQNGQVLQHNGDRVVSESERNPDTEMLFFADAAIQSLRFQFWKGDFYEKSLDYLDIDFDDSVAMFFTRIGKYTKDQKVNVMSMDRGYKGLASLAARLEQTESYYRRALSEIGQPTYSLYEVILMALKDRDLFSQQAPLARTKARVLQWKAEAILLLQLRHNYLPGMVLARMTNMNEKSMIGKLMSGVLGIEAQLDSEDPTKSRSNEEIREWTLWLNEAIETRSRLQAIGIKPEYNSTIGAGVKALNFGQKSILSAKSAPADGTRARLIYDFAVAYEKVKGEMTSIIPSIKFVPAKAAKSEGPHSDPSAAAVVQPPARDKLL